MIFRSVYSIRHNAAPKKKAHIRKTTVGNIKSALHVCSLLYPGDSWALFSDSPLMLIPDELADKFLWDRVLHGNASGVQLVIY